MSSPAPGPTGAIQQLGWGVAIVACIAGAAMLPIELLLVGLGALVVGAVLLRAHHDTTLIVVVLLWVMALIPARLTIPALGSLGAPTTLVSLAAAGIWFLVWVNPRKTIPGFRPVPLLLGFFLFSIVASYAAAGLRAKGSVEVLAADRGIITAVASVGVAFLIAETVSSRNRLDTIIKSAVAAGTVIAGFGIFQFATGDNLAAQITVPGLESNVEGDLLFGQRSIFERVAGTTSHPIEYSVVICMVLPLALHLAMHHSRKWYLAAAVLVVALPMSVSRTAALGLVAVAVVIVPGWPRRVRHRAYGAVAGYVVVMKLLVPGLLDTIEELFANAGADASISSRVVDYGFVGEFFAQRPILGRGFFTFIPTRFDFIDNQYLLSLVETGLLGVTAFITLTFGGVLTAHAIRRRATTEVDRDLAQALMASLVVVAVTAVAFDFLSFSSVRILLFVTLGCIGALWRFVPGREGDRMRTGDTDLAADEPTSTPIAESVGVGAR